MRRRNSLTATRLHQLSVLDCQTTTSPITTNATAAPRSAVGSHSAIPVADPIEAHTRIAPMANGGHARIHDECLRFCIAMSPRTDSRKPMAPDSRSRKQFLQKNSMHLRDTSNRRLPAMSAAGKPFKRFRRFIDSTVVIQKLYRLDHRR